MLDRARLAAARRELRERSSADGKRLSFGDLAGMVEEEFDRSGLGELVEGRTMIEPDDRYFFPYHYLDLKADEYRLILHHEYVSRLNIVKGLLDLSMGQFILDAGCGDGRFLYEIRDEPVVRIGIDCSERALAFARIFNPTMTFVRADLRTFDHVYRFDAIVMLEVLEHFTPDDAQIVLEKLANHLKPGGKLIVSVPSVKMAVESDHQRHFTEETLRELLQAYLSVVKVLGHTRSRGWRTGLWWKFRRVCTWLYPLRHHVGAVTRLLEWLNEVYSESYAVGKPEECNGIIAVCER